MDHKFWAAGLLLFLGGDGAEEKWREKAYGAHTPSSAWLVGSWRSGNHTPRRRHDAMIEEAMARHSG